MKVPIEVHIKNPAGLGKGYVERLVFTQGPSLELSVKIDLNLPTYLVFHLINDLKTN
jgi:hypothetical protein